MTGRITLVPTSNSCVPEPIDAGVGTGYLFLVTGMSGRQYGVTKKFYEKEGVFLADAFHPDTNGVVVKALDATASNSVLARLFRESVMMSQLGSENLEDQTHIVQLIDTCENPLTIIMERLEGITLAELLAEEGGKLPVDRALEIGLQICAGLKYIHSKNFVHRDLTNNNIILVHRRTAKLIDLGDACRDGELVEDVRGTPPFTAPELLKKGSTITTKVDIYALGILLYLMTEGAFPWGTTDSPLEQMMDWHLSDSGLDDMKHAPGGLKRLIHDMTSRDPNQRPTAEEVQSRLQNLLSDSVPTAVADERTVAPLGRINSAHLPPPPPAAPSLTSRIPTPGSRPPGVPTSATDTQPTAPIPRKIESEALTQPTETAPTSSSRPTIRVAVLSALTAPMGVPEVSQTSDVALVPTKKKLENISGEIIVPDVVSRKEFVLPSEAEPRRSVGRFISAPYRGALALIGAVTSLALKMFWKSDDKDNQ